jgi:putative spermidine/putrescine transport system permease protein
MMRFGVPTFAILVLIFMISPIFVIFPLSFSSSSVLTLPVPGYSLQWYEDFFLNGRWLSATKNSFIVGFATMLIAGLLGTMAAFGLNYSDFRGKKFVLAALSLPMVVPLIVTATSMFLAFSIVGIANSLWGLIVAHTIIAAPYVVITVLASIQTFDMNLLRAALSLGAHPVTAFREVVLPMIMPGVIAGAIFAFATSFDELVIAIFITGPGQFTLPRQMFAGLREFLSPTISAAAVIMVVFSFVLLFISEFVRRRGERLKSSTNA